MTPLCVADTRDIKGERPTLVLVIGGPLRRGLKLASGYSESFRDADIRLTPSSAGFEGLNPGLVSPAMVHPMT